MRVPETPEVPGVLSADQVRATAAAIASVQEPSGAIPWFPGGHVDPWDHVECAMALLVGGQPEAAERAYAWLLATQRPDGSWPLRTSRGVVEDAGADTNMCAYLAVGVWHHWLVRRDEDFVSGAWAAVRRALDFVTDLQLDFGGVAWAQNEYGGVLEDALVAGSASVHHALGAGLALADLVGEPQPAWEIAAARLGHALRCHEDSFDARTRHSMDWYYPVLGGAVRGAPARVRLDRRWRDFVVPGLGIRCVDDNPWVTGAETCELVLCLEALGERDRATELLADMQHLRDPDGSYWTGYVFADDARWPEECSTWTAAAVVLAADALCDATPGAALFRTEELPGLGADMALDCGCAGQESSAERVTGLSTHPG